MTHTSEARVARSSSTDPIVVSLRVAAVLSVLVLLWQFVTAGSLLPEGSESTEALHATGAIVLHVVTGLTAIAAGLAWRLRGAPVWPTVLATVVFVLTFVQAYTGGYDSLWIHVPGSLIVSIGTVVVAVWAFSRGARGTARI